MVESPKRTVVPGPPMAPARGGASVVSRGTAVVVTNGIGNGPFLLCQCKYSTSAHTVVSGVGSGNFVSGGLGGRHRFLNDRKSASHGSAVPGSGTTGTELPGATNAGWPQAGAPAG